MSDNDGMVEEYIRLLRKGSEDAFFSLIEIDPHIIPQLQEAFQCEKDPEIRARLVEIIWQYRKPEITPFLAQALNDTGPVVWKAALDGLVALASPESINILEHALKRTFPRKNDERYYREWIHEALKQARARIDV